MKALKVKTSGLKRVHKEAGMYAKERDKEQAKVDKLKADGADPHDIKQAVRVCVRAWPGAGSSSWRQVRAHSLRSRARAHACASWAGKRAERVCNDDP